MPAGHYYSCVPDLTEVLARADTLFDTRHRDCPSIDLRVESQLALLRSLSAYYEEQPFSHDPKPPLRYYFRNIFFTQADAIVLYSLLRHLRPRKVIEIGSGFSSAVMLDTNDLFLDRSVEFTFVDPFPKRLFSLLRPRDRERVTVVQEPVQRLQPEFFASLSAGDFLFIDSSHVVKIGSDVLHIFFNVLPALTPGVVVHFHDILWPFEYSKDQLMEGRAWSEAYLLRAFLQFNGEFEIVYFNSYLGVHHASALREKMPLCLEDPGGSLWLRRIDRSGGSG